MSPATKLPNTLDALFGSIEALPLVAALRTSELAYPLVNAAHVVGVALLFGAIVPLDLRLLGWRRRAGPVDAIATLLVPVAIFGLLLAVAAGLLLFTTDARAYAASALFRTKMALLAIAIANALALRRLDWRPEPALRRVRAAAAASLLLWLAVILLGRVVGYF